MDDRLSKISEHIAKSIEAKNKIKDDVNFNHIILKITDYIIASYKAEGKVLFCGNGGSAADAQHLSAELSGRFKKDRKPLNSEALHVNTSYLTAVANDYSYDDIYSRLIEARGKSGDVLIAISTSGNSKNIIKAVEKAKKKEMITVGFTGNKGHVLSSMCDLSLIVPSSDTAIIQESHIMLGHIICDIVESTFF
tara:strand:- start:1864 stop:2445 length:582 start_codon:yes stop_codon:yes gene_type:complete